jgi:hypothetical protein
MPTVIVHFANEDSVMGDLEELPLMDDTLILVKNPRRKDGKELPNLDQNVTQVIWTIHRITFIEIVPTGEGEEIISFVRE